MGRNGVGKTTLLNVVRGQLPVKNGQIEFDGQDITKYSVERRAEIGIGYVPQGRQIFPLLTVEENLKIGLPARRDGKRQIPVITSYSIHYTKLYEMASGNGRIEAVEIDIAAKAAGRLKDILVREGDFVTTGQTLAVMDTENLAARITSYNVCYTKLLRPQSGPPAAAGDVRPCHR